MFWIHFILTSILVLICAALMFLILTQRSKGEGLGGAFGMGGGSDTVLGSRVSVLQKYTAYLVGVFMLLCFVISVLPPATKTSVLLPAAGGGSGMTAPVVPGDTTTEEATTGDAAPSDTDASAAEEAPAPPAPGNVAPSDGASSDAAPVDAAPVDAAPVDNAAAPSDSAPPPADDSASPAN